MFMYTQGFICILASVKMIRTHFFNQFCLLSSIDDIVVYQMVRRKTLYTHFKCQYQGFLLPKFDIGPLKNSLSVEL